MGGDIRDSPPSIPAKRFQLRAKRRPVLTVRLAFLLLLLLEFRRKLAEIPSNCGFHDRTVRCRLDGPFRESLRQFDKTLGGAAFPQPPAGLIFFRSREVADYVSLDETLDHGPILVPLSLLGSDQVPKTHYFHRRVDPFYRVTTLPHQWKRINTPEPAHDIDPKPLDPGGMTPKVTRVSPRKVLDGKRRDKDLLCFEFAESVPEVFQVPFLREDHAIAVPAELGRSVENRCLAADQEVSNVPRRES